MQEGIVTKLHAVERMVKLTNSQKINKHAFVNGGLHPSGL
jgi:hypothetical protein